MHEDHEQLDQELIRLEHSLDRGDHMLACLQLAEFALKLDLYIRREERVLALKGPSRVTTPRVLASVHREHTRLRQMVALIASALDRADDGRCAAMLGTLRSVLLLHMTKEDLLMAMPASRTIH